MARQKSDKSKFRSIYSNSYVTAAQYITEALFYLIAKSKNIDLIVKPYEINFGDNDVRKLFLAVDLVEASS